MRVDGWESRLTDAIEAARHCPFVWGTHDCALFAADVVLAITGVDYAETLRGNYSTRHEAMATIMALGYRSLSGYIGTLFNEVPTSQARRGDLVLFDNSLGVCAGHVSFFVAESGLDSRQTAECERAWAIE